MSNKKDLQLGMTYGKASHRLKKNILYSLAVKLEIHKCFQCGKLIETPEELSVEHKIPWLDSEDPKKLFFSLENIAFSHLICNSLASRKTNQKYFTKEERLFADRKSSADSKRRKYTPEARHKKWIETGY
jgi:5-methylcytosine-specific restriction endonuclease McrA